MKQYVIRSAAIVGLAAAFAAPAHAHRSDLEVTIRPGGAYGQHDAGYDRHGRHYRDHRHRHKHKKRHRRFHHRLAHAHERWHWFNDHRWDRYYDHDHWRLHHDMGGRHRDVHRKKRRYR